MSTLKQQISQLREQFQIKKQVKKEDNVYENTDRFAMNYTVLPTP